MTASPDSVNLYEELCRLVDLGPRFHGTAGEEDAAEYLDRRLDEAGIEVSRHQVSTPAWRTNGASHLVVTSPRQWDLECWPMLWTAGTSCVIEGTLHVQGRQGLWDNSFVWTKFIVQADERPIAYISARDDGPAAPQPLPAGSSPDVPHLAIGHIDGQRLRDWIEDGTEVRVRLEAAAEQDGLAVGHNLAVSLPGTDRTAGEIVVCGHYDTFWNTVGAYDNGSGTVALLELARRWTVRPPRRPVRLVFFAAEEWHLAGSRSLVASLSPGQCAEIDLVLNMDGLGRGNLLEVSIGPESFEHSLIKAIRNFADTRPDLVLSSRFPPLMGTDHAPFYAAGVPSAHLTFNDWRLLHRPEDVPNRASANNIGWTVALLERLVEVLEPPERGPRHDIL